MNQQLLALQGIANGSDELGNLLLLDRNEQRDDKEFIQVRWELLLGSTYYSTSVLMQC